MSKTALMERAMTLLKENPERSHADVAKEVGVSQGGLSNYVRNSGDKKLLKAASKRLSGGNSKKKAKRKPGKKDVRGPLVKPDFKVPVFTEMPQFSSGGKTLLIITDDQETIKSILESFQ